MKALTRGVLVALVLACALAVVAPPAFATGMNTASINNTGPFFTPVGNTRDSKSTFVAGRVDFSGLNGMGAAVTVTCRSQMSGYVPETHTRVRMTAVGFGGCVTNIGVVSFVNVTVSSQNPFTLHVTSEAGSGSWNTTLGIPMGQHISINITLGEDRFCGITIATQSIRAVDTDVARTLALSDPTVTFVLDAGSDPELCPDPARTLTVIGTYMFAPDTENDDFGSTLLS
jgi:hypothetical protein